MGRKSGPGSGNEDSKSTDLLAEAAIAGLAVEMQTAERTVGIQTRPAARQGRLGRMVDRLPPRREHESVGRPCGVDMRSDSEEGPGLIGSAEAVMRTGTRIRHEVWIESDAGCVRGTIRRILGGRPGELTLAIAWQ